MIALPSIAFGGFSGSAKDVTARQRDGRSILTVRCWPTGPKTNAQVVRRSSMSKITKSYKTLTAEQMQAWENLAKYTSGQSVLGQRAELSGINLFVRLNANRVMAGEAIIADAPETLVNVPNAAYNKVFVTPELVIFLGIEHQPAPNKLVVKMSGSQSPGISNGWSKTVIISPDVEDDWGEADVTQLYLKTIGVEPTPGQKVFIETYWLDTATGFTGQVYKSSTIAITQEQAIAEGYAPRKRVNMDNIDLERSQVESFDLDFSTASPVVNHSGVLTSKPAEGYSYIYAEAPLERELLGISFCIGRGVTEDGKLMSQSVYCHLSNINGGAHLSYSHRGGTWSRPSEVFGPGIIF